MDLIKISQWMNIIYEIHETYYTDIIWFEAHKNNLSELKPMHTWVNEIRIRTCTYVHFAGTCPWMTNIGIWTVPHKYPKCIFFFTNSRAE